MAQAHIRINFHCFILLNAYVLFLMPCFVVTRIESGTHNTTSSLHKLALTHIDFASHDNSTLYQRMQKAVRRSNLRVQYLHQSILASSSAGRVYQTPVYAAFPAFVTTAAIGTPPVSFEAILDTGSDLVWLQCQPCVYCYASNTIFNPSASSTYTKVACNDPICTDLPLNSCDPTCSYLYPYGDLSYSSGDFSYDTLTLPDILGNCDGIPTFAFGCGHDNEGGSFAGADGIIGFGQGPISLPSQLGSGKFLYCLQSISDNAFQASPLFIGPGIMLSGSNVQSTNIIPNSVHPTYYYVGLKGISVGGKALNIPAGTFDFQSDGSGGMIIDSGTTLTYLATAGYALVREAFTSSITLPTADGSSLGLDLCYSSSGTVPSLTFHFDGADFVLPPENYFIYFSQEGLFCLAMNESNLGISIFGNIQQQNFAFLYDIGARKLSFTSTTCDSL